MKVSDTIELVVLIAAPVVMALSAYLPTGQAAFVSSAAALVALAVVFLFFDRSKPPLQKLMPTVVLAALAAAGRILFAAIADFKPVSAICIIAGATFGKRCGFMVGALAAIVSNFFFGQGVWTLWQMYAWGMVGYLAGVLGQRGLLEKTPVLLGFGFLSAMVYGLFLNGWYVVGFVRPLTWPAVLAAYAAGFSLDCVHGAATVVFLMALYVPWRQKLQRIQRKYALIGACQ